MKNYDEFYINCNGLFLKKFENELIKLKIISETWAKIRKQYTAYRGFRFFFNFNKDNAGDVVKLCFYRNTFVEAHEKNV